MMHEGRQLNARPFSLECGFAAQVLLEGMKLADQEAACRHQRACCFGEDEGEIGNVLKHQVASDQVHRLVSAGPGLREIGGGERHRLAKAFGPGLRQHPF